MERRWLIFYVLFTLVVVLGVLGLLFGKHGNPLCFEIAGKSKVMMNGVMSSQDIVSVDAPIPSSSKKHLLCIAIPNRVTSRVNRDTIRKTWLSDYRRDPRVKAKFVIGTRTLTKHTVARLVEEQLKYGDILLLGQLVDSYSNLTRKLLYSVQWMDRHGSCEYLMKCDDDVVVRLGPILNELASRNSTKGLYWGFIENEAEVQSTGKYAENSWDLCPEYYFPYAIGGGYILSGDLVHMVASQANVVRRYANADVTMGVWLSPYDIERKHDERFESFPPGSYTSTLPTDQILIRVVENLEDVWQFNTV